MLTFGSLFTGVGGFDLGFERAGMQCLWQCEIDKHAAAVLEKHWPNTTRYTDVREIGKHNLAAVDVICGGFPCQDLSVAGHRKGLAGERSGLWFEFHRILEEVRPHWCVIENVPGLLSSNKGRDFAVLLSGLVELGYGVTWRVLDSQYFGVAQRRKRVFIVGSLGDGSSAEVLLESEGVPGDTAPGREAGESTANTVASGTYQNTGHGYWQSRDVAQSLRTGSGSKESNLVVPTLRGFGHGWQGQHNDTHAVVYTAGQHHGWKQDNNLGPLTHGQNDHVRGDTPIVLASGQHNAEITVDIAPALTLLHEQPIVADKLVGLRRLTPIECERLQGFPDGWTAGQSDTQRYKQMGNAVTVNVIEWIGRRIVDAASRD